MADIETKGDEVVHNEGIDGVDHGVSGLSKGQFIHARETALSATRDPWTVLKENVRVLLAIISVQVRNPSRATAHLKLRTYAEFRFDLWHRDRLPERPGG